MNSQLELPIQKKYLVLRKLKYSIYGMSFVFPIMIMIVGFAFNEVYPFGTKSGLIIDGTSQYLGFFKEMLVQLNNPTSIFYSQHALGYNFYSLFTYYLTSPFNILIILLNNFLYINESVTIVVLIKIGLISVSMTWYLYKHMKDAKQLAVAFGVMYALSNYVLGYYANLMWLDCVMILPVVALGIEEMIIKKEKWKTYCLSLFYAIFSNYYIGFIVCIFAVLYFVYCFILYGSKERKVRTVNMFLAFILRQSICFFMDFINLWECLTDKHLYLRSY